MSARKNKKFKLYWWRYILLSIPFTFVIRLIIQYKITFLFWTYIAIMGITSMIAKWYMGEEDKNKFIAYSVHIAMTSTITLFMWSLLDHISK